MRCSHLQDDTVPPQFAIPQPFYKSPPCLIAGGEAIVIPRDATVVHYEANRRPCLHRHAGKNCGDLRW